MHNLTTILKKYRVENGLTQKQLGDILGISRSHVANLERGDREPSYRLIRTLVSTMGNIFFNENDSKRTSELQKTGS